MSFSGNSFNVTSYILDETFIRFINYLNWFISSVAE